MKYHIIYNDNKLKKRDSGPFKLFTIFYLILMTYSTYAQQLKQ